MNAMEQDSLLPEGSFDQKFLSPLDGEEVNFPSNPRPFREREG